LADFLVGDDEDSFVFAPFGFVPKAFGIVHAGRDGVAPGIEQEETDGTEFFVSVSSVCSC
jgi:hypothetical protein